MNQHQLKVIDLSSANTLFGLELKHFRTHSAFRYEVLQIAEKLTINMLTIDLPSH